MIVSLLNVLLKIPSPNSPHPYQIGLYKNPKKEVPFEPAAKYLPERN
jgi:hypothetical protein